MNNKKSTISIFHSSDDEVIVIGSTTTQSSVTSSESWSWSPPASTQGGGWTPWTPTTTATTETNFADSSSVQEPLIGDYKVVCCKFRGIIYTWLKVYAKSLNQNIF